MTAAANRWDSKEDFIAFLEGTLIPDLKESGRDCTAEDFETAVHFMKYGEADPTAIVSDKQLADTLCAGMEGGINYWAAITGYRKPKTKKLFKWDPTKASEPVYKHIHYPMTPGGAVKILVTETTVRIGGKERSKFELTYADLRRGLAVMAEKYPKQFADIVGDGGDAWTGDCLIQCALFGETVFG